jgi:hypothetical protein
MTGSSGLTWLEEMQEAVARLVREARLALHQETGRLGREEAKAYLDAVQAVAGRLGAALPDEEEGPIRFARRYVTELGTSPGEGEPPARRQAWVRGRNNAIRAVNAAKLATLKNRRSSAATDAK